MNICVFGASGRTGLLIVFQALHQGHRVTAFARNATKVTIRHPNLTVIEGELNDFDTLKRAVEGHDAVLCALGVDSRKPGTVLSEGTRSIIRAMEATGVKRLVCMSSAGILGNDAGFWFGKVIVPLFLKHVFADKRRQAEIIRNSTLEWVIVRPVGLTDSPKTGSYKINPGIPTSHTVPRSDVADFMIKCAADKKYDGSMPALSGR